MVDESNCNEEQKGTQHCPGAKLGNYIHWIDVERFALLRENEPYLRRGQEMKEYLERQRIGRELFQFLDPVLRDFICPDEFFYPVSDEVHDERMAASDRTEELMRRSIAAGLSEHVRSCRSCRAKYDILIQRLVREKMGLEQNSQNLQPSPQDSFFQGMLTAEIKETDIKLLGLYSD